MFENMPRNALKSQNWISDTAIFYNNITYNTIDTIIMQAFENVIRMTTFGLDTAKSRP